MLRISASVDYALRAAVILARSDGRAVTVTEIAAAERLPRKFLAATLAAMRSAGLLDSRRGGKGGFWLAVPASEVTVADLIRAVDGVVVHLGAVDADGPTEQWWSDAAGTIEALLASTTLADLCERLPVQREHAEVDDTSAADMR